MKLLRLQSDRILQCLHKRGVFGDVVILAANPLGDPYWAAGAAIDHHSNARWPRIPQATTVHVGHEFCYHCDFFCSLKDALIAFQRQDDYLVPFHRFDDAPDRCAILCVKPGRIKSSCG